METLHRVQPTSSDLLTLKIKSEDGDCVFILKMCFSETIGHLRRYLDEHRWDHVSLHVDCIPNATPCALCYRGSGLCGYDIISAYPRCCYSDESQTLDRCGFASNSTLLLRKRKRWTPQKQEVTQIRVTPVRKSKCEAAYDENLYF